MRVRVRVKSGTSRALLAKDEGGLTRNRPYVEVAGQCEAWGKLEEGVENRFQLGARKGRVLKREKMM